MKKAVLTGTSESKPEDITLDPEFLNEQIERLLGWEIMLRECLAQKEPIPAQELCDRIGVNKNYIHWVLEDIRERISNED